MTFKTIIFGTLFGNYFHEKKFWSRNIVNLKNNYQKRIFPEFFLIKSPLISFEISDDFLGVELCEKFLIVRRLAYQVPGATRWFIVRSIRRLFYSTSFPCPPRDFSSWKCSIQSNFPLCIIGAQLCSVSIIFCFRNFSWQQNIKYVGVILKNPWLCLQSSKLAFILNHDFVSSECLYLYSIFCEEEILTSQSWTTIFWDSNHETFKVTCYPANHCFGACMFVFEGYFGRFLHTGIESYAKSTFPEAISAVTNRFITPISKTSTECTLTILIFSHRTDF